MTFYLEKSNKNDGESKTHKNFIVSITHLNSHQFDTLLFICRTHPVQFAYGTAINS